MKSWVFGDMAVIAAGRAPFMVYWAALYRPRTIGPERDQPRMRPCHRNSVGVHTCPRIRARKHGRRTDGIGCAGNRDTGYRWRSAVVLQYAMLHGAPGQLPLGRESMQRFASGFSTFTKYCVAGLCLLLVAACGLSGEGSFPAQSARSKHSISAPEFHVGPELKLPAGPLAEVSGLTIVAPKKGEKLLTNKSAFVSLRGHRRIEMSYVYESDLEQAVQSAMEHVFSVNPGVDRSAFVKLKVGAWSAQRSNGWCEIWVTTVNVALEIQLQTPKGVETTRSYKAKAVDESCTSLGRFASLSAIEDIVEDAFQSAMQQAVEDRDSLR